MERVGKEHEFEYSHGESKGLDGIDVLTAWILATLFVTSLILSI